MSCAFVDCIVNVFGFLAQVTRPVPFPCFGVLKKEKHVLLPSVADVIVEQGKRLAPLILL